jgi:hypothetical protein
MRKTIGLALISAVSFGCASLTPQGAAVRVYQAEVKTPETPAPALPDGCKLVAASGPIDQQEQERNTSDPYRSQRNATAEKGGNVLLVKSSRFMTLKRTECSESDPRNCPDSAQNWYKVSFGSYACDAAALAVLAESKPAPESKALFEWSPKKNSVPAPAAVAPAVAAAPASGLAIPPGQPAPVGASSTTAAVLKSKILALLQEGVGTDVIVSYVRANRLPAPLTAEEIIDWKKAGVPDAVIRATFPN